MGRIIHDHYQTSKMEKKSIKLNRSWNMEEGDKVTNTLSNGLDIRSQRPHGNQNLVSQEQQRSYKDTKNTTSCKATCLSSGRQNRLPISTSQGNTSLMMSLRNISSWKASLKTWSKNIYIYALTLSAFPTHHSSLSPQNPCRTLNQQVNQNAFYQNWTMILCWTLYAILSNP